MTYRISPKYLGLVGKNGNAFNYNFKLWAVVNLIVILSPGLELLESGCLIDGHVGKSNRAFVLTEHYIFRSENFRIFQHFLIFSYNVIFEFL